MKFTIIGAGNGGQSMAAHLKIMKQQVVLYDIQENLIQQINDRGHITVEGVIEGSVPIKATTDVADALKETDVIMVTTTGPAHKSVAKSIAPYLKDGQLIMILPGYWGALEFRKTFKQLGIQKNVYVAETESLIYTCRSIHPGHVRIRKIKDSLEFASLPASDSPIVKDILKDIYPQLKIASNVLITTMNNCNPIFHVPITLMNAGRIESEGDFYFYPDGATPSVVNVMEQLERERLEIGKKLKINLSTCLDLLNRFYDVKEANLYDAIQSNPAYRTGKAPTTLRYRYIYEDIPYGLIPMVSLGEKLGVDMACSNLLVDLASIAMKEDLRKRGLTLLDLGIDGMSKEEIVEYLAGSAGRVVGEVR